MSKVLLDEQPLVILPGLAKELGLNEAIILQQVHYWLKRSPNIRDNRPWVYNSYPEWQKQFPFWGLNTIRRAIARLEQQGILINANYNKFGADRTKWYSIDYEVVRGLGIWTAQNGQMDCPKWADGAAQNGLTNTRDYTEITPETTPSIPYAEIVAFLNQTVRTSYKHTTKATQEKIRARWNEGFRLDDFKAVITKKARKWLDTEQAQYLRPETLFGTKFEGYLNEPETSTKKNSPEQPNKYTHQRQISELSQVTARKTMVGLGGD